MAQWIEATFSPAGSNIFAPELMQGYLDPAKNFGEVCDRGWDPQVVDDAVFPLDDIFCLVGTDPADYGWGPRTVMGPQTDGASQNPASVADQLPAGEGAPLAFQLDGTTLVASVALPGPALQAGLLGSRASIRIAVSPRVGPS